MFISKKMNIALVSFIYLSITVPIFFIQGCSTTSPLFSARDNKASVIIIKPPMKIIISGEYAKLNTDHLIDIMREIRKHPYHNYNFDESISIDSEHTSVHKDNYSTSYKNSIR
jgi:20S proteasome alpha/beta subunit